MPVKKKPFAAKEQRDRYLMIGHIKEWAVIQSEAGDLFVLLDEERMLPPGTYMEHYDLISVTELPGQLQRRILREFGGENI